MGFHRRVDLAEAEEAELPDATVLAVVDVRRGDVAGRVGVDRDGVEGATRAGRVELLEIRVVVAGQRAGVHLRAAVGGLDGAVEARSIAPYSGALIGACQNDEPSGSFQISHAETRPR